MAGSKATLALGLCALGAAVAFLVGDQEPEYASDGLAPGPDLQLASGGLDLGPRLPITPSEAPAESASVEVEDPNALAPGLMLSESGEEIFTRERAVEMASQILLNNHMPKPTAFDRSYTRWPAEITPETSQKQFGRTLTHDEIAGIQAIQDEYLPDMLAYAALMRADYSDMISNVESTQSYSLDRIEPSQLKDRPPVNHNLITMPGWRATYPVGFDTYPHLHTTSQAADSLRLKRDRDVKSYLIASR